MLVILIQAQPFYMEFNKMTKDEKAFWKSVTDDKEKALAEAEAKETAKSAILDRIGLTADELKTILG